MGIARLDCLITSVLLPKVKMQRLPASEAGEL